MSQDGCPCEQIPSSCTSQPSVALATCGVALHQAAIVSEDGSCVVGFGYRDLADSCICLIRASCLTRGSGSFTEIICSIEIIGANGQEQDDERCDRAPGSHIRLQRLTERKTVDSRHANGPHVNPSNSWRTHGFQQ